MARARNSSTSKGRRFLLVQSSNAWLPICAGSALLAGCGEKPVDPDNLVVCRPAEASGFARECTVERSESPDGAILTLRHPDGGFRRLLVAKDGKGVVAADGAEPAEVRMSGDDAIEVTLGGSRYRLPAKAKAFTKGAE